MRSFCCDVVEEKAMPHYETVVSFVVFNPLKPNGNYIFHLLQQSVTLYFVFMGFV
jgi:hypothetical protein